MIRNYLTIAWRSLRKNKGYTAINVGGLAVGMAVAILIGIWVHDELTFNGFYKNGANIAQVMQHARFNGKINTQSSVPAAMGPELRSRFGSDFKYVVQASWEGSHLLSLNDKHIVKDGIFFEPDAPEMLNLTMRAGSRNGLRDPHSILLSASVAAAMFGTENPLNKTIKFDKNYPVKVTGIYEDLPENVSFHNVKIIVPWELWLIQNPWVKTMKRPWDSNFSQTFVQIADGTQMDKLSGKIKTVKLDNLDPESKKYEWAVFLHPMEKWNLYSEFKDGVNTGGNITYVKLFSIIGLFVLLLACINFMNLSTAKSESRAKEVGIRKTVGSLRWQLVCRFFAESYLVVLLAFLLSLILVILLLPLFNEIAGKAMEIPLANALFWLASMGFIFITGLLAGSYPSLYLSSFEPLKVLKGTFKAGRFASIPRRALVIIQFTVSILLIIGTIIIYQQIQYAKNRPVGYTRQGLLNLSLQEEVQQHFDAVKTELINTGAISSMAATYSPLTSVWNTNGGFDWEGKDPNLAVDFPNSAVSFDFGKTIGWQVLNGRDFSKDFATDSLAFVINESAARFLGFSNPVGKTLKWNNRFYTIIGVVADLLQESPYFPVRPSLYHIGKYADMSNLVIKLNPHQSTSAAITSIEKVWKKYIHEAPFGYTFVDENFGAKFKLEERIGKLSSYFSILAIFISCLGLLGLASFTAEQRTKEIGIRKVLGAGMVGLWQLLTREFVLLVIVSALIASPIAWYYLSRWLENYDYKISLSWTVFATAALLALVITLLTVSYQAIRAAMMNPVKSLRAE